MRTLLSSVDQVLRGGYSLPGPGGHTQDFGPAKAIAPMRTLLLAGLLFGSLYGVFMGLYGATRASTPSGMQLFASAVKVPLLFSMTLAVTFPSLYVLSALCRSHLVPLETLRLILSSMLVHLTLLASFGPITGFFTMCTESYPFMVILNVILLTISGCMGLAFLARALQAVFAHAPADLTGPGSTTPEKSTGESGSAEPGPDSAPSQVVPVAANSLAARQHQQRSKHVFQFWTVIYGIVGAQMGWVLRPFIGAPNVPFQWFRSRESNFFEAICSALDQLLS